MLTQSEMQQRYEAMHRANEARLTQLAKDADDNVRKFTNAEPYTVENQKQAMYYSGMRDGLRRALKVLEGRG